jgi:signal transduction histidine kinase
LIRSLRRKFIAMTMAVFTALLCVIFGLVIHFTGQNLQAESVRFLRSAAADPLQPGPPGQVRQPCFIIRATPWGQSIQSTGGFDLSDEQMLSDIVALAASASEPLGVLDGYDLRYFRSQSPAELTLVFMDISAERAALRNLRLTCVGIGLLALGLFWAVSFLLARWAVRPVERAWEEQRQFVSDASHELKTPLTVILTSAELMQTDPDPQHPRSILAMSRRMRELVESLLELARVDNGAVRAAFADTDLSGLVEEELLPFEPVYFERGLELDCAVEPDLHVLGSPRHLRQVVAILLDNAVNHAPEGSTVRLHLHRQGGTAQLTVTNPGDLSREDCRNIFLRFYRVDAARSGGGYGLGLPIAQGIVRDHGGKIWAESREGTVTLSAWLPIRK